MHLNQDMKNNPQLWNNLNICVPVYRLILISIIGPSYLFTPKQMCFIELMGFYQTSEPLRKRSGALRPVENLPSASRAEQEHNSGRITAVLSQSSNSLRTVYLLALLMFVGKIRERIEHLKGFN